MDPVVLDIQSRLEKHLSENFDKFHGKKKTTFVIAEWINENFKQKKDGSSKRDNQN